MVKKTAPYGRPVLRLQAFGLSLKDDSQKSVILKGREALQGPGGLRGAVFLHQRARKHAPVMKPRHAPKGGASGPVPLGGSALKTL